MSWRRPQRHCPWRHCHWAKYHPEFSRSDHFNNSTIIIFHCRSWHGSEPDFGPTGCIGCMAENDLLIFNVGIFLKNNVVLTLIMVLCLSSFSLACSSGGNLSLLVTNSPITTTPPVTTVPSTNADSYTLTVSIQGKGKVVPSMGSHIYPKGTSVNLTAIPDYTWEFNLWIGNVTDTMSASTTVIMNSDQTVTAYLSLTVCEN